MQNTCIDEALMYFIKIFNDNPEHNFGKMEYSTKKLDISNANIKLTGEIRYFYEHAILLDKPMFGGVLDMNILNKNDLKRAISGWLVPEDELWPEHYVIFAERGGTLLFCDVLDDKSPVYGNIYGENYKLANTLHEFLKIYSTLSEVERIDFNNDLISNEESEFYSKVDDILNTTLTLELKSNFIYFFIG